MLQRLLPPSGLRWWCTWSRLKGLPPVYFSPSLDLVAGPPLSPSFIEQLPVNRAPGSIESLPVTIVPLIFEEAFRFKSCVTLILPSITPDTSEFLHSTSPFTRPVDPMTTLPLVTRLPLRVPSIRISPDDLMSPVISVP